MHLFTHKLMQPVKDYDANRLIKGDLQLPCNTHIIVDETTLSAATIKEGAIKNLRCLQRVISDQVLEFDFKYHQLDFHVDYPVAIVSKGKSILQHASIMVANLADGADLGSASGDQVVGNTDQDTDNKASALVDTGVSECELDVFRVYLSCARHVNFQLTPEAEKKMVELFVSLRKVDVNRMTPAALHTSMSLIRLISISFNEETLNTADRWGLIEKLITQLTQSNRMRFGQGK